MDLLFRRHGNKNKLIMVPAPGYPLFRNIQPAAWSRKKGIHGLDPLELPVYQLCRYEASRVRSSPFECRQVCGFGVHKIGAESVFTARQLKSMRENAVDIDSIANHLHQTSSSTTSTPSKNDAAQDQLAAAGLSDQHQSHTISPKQPPKHSPSSAHLGSTPKRKARRMEETTQKKLSKIFPPQEHQHLRCQRLPKAPAELQGLFLTVMMMFFAFRFGNFGRFFSCA